MVCPFAASGINPKRRLHVTIASHPNYYSLAILVRYIYVGTFQAYAGFKSRLFVQEDLQEVHLGRPVDGQGPKTTTPISNLGVRLHPHISSNDPSTGSVQGPVGFKNRRGCTFPRIWSVEHVGCRLI